MPNVQPEGTSTEITTDLSSFMAINFEAKEQQTNTIVGNTIESFAENELASIKQEIICLPLFFLVFLLLLFLSSLFSSCFSASDFPQFENEFKSTIAVC